MNNIDTGPLCDQLADAGLINDDQKRRAKNSHNDAGNRASDLVSMLLNQVEQDYQNFHRLIRVLEEDARTYGPVLQDLRLSGSGTNTVTYTAQQSTGE